MAGYILSGKVGMGKSLGYAGVFTLVHLADVIGVVLLSKYIFEYFDPAVYLAQIEKAAVVVLLSISIWYLFRSVRFALRARQSGFKPESVQSDTSLA